MLAVELSAQAPWDDLAGSLSLSLVSWDTISQRGTTLQAGAPQEMRRAVVTSLKYSGNRK